MVRPVDVDAVVGVQVHVQRSAGTVRLVSLAILFTGWLAKQSKPILYFMRAIRTLLAENTKFSPALSRSRFAIRQKSTLAKSGKGGNGQKLKTFCHTALAFAVYKKSRLFPVETRSKKDQGSELEVRELLWESTTAPNGNGMARPADVDAAAGVQDHAQRSAGTVRITTADPATHKGVAGEED